MRIGLDIGLGGFRQTPRGGEAGALQPFTLTAGQVGTEPSVNTGYYSDSPSGAGAYGSISNEPLEGFALDRFGTAGGGAYFMVSFLGDCVSTVTGWVPAIDGVPVAGTWALQEGEAPLTYMLITENLPVLENSVQYAITWQAA